MKHLLRALSALFAMSLTVGCASSGDDQPMAHWRTGVTPTAPVEAQDEAPSTTANATFHETYEPSSGGVAVAATTPETDGVVTTGLAPATFGEEGDDFDPCVSRDGAFLVFASTQHSQTSDIFIKGIAGRMVTQLTNDPAQDAMPAISPDGSTIAYANNRSGNWNLFVMSVAGGRALQLTDGVEDEVFPSFSPDGSRLVFSRRNIGSGKWEMWTIPLTSSGNPTFIGLGYRPRWCPVGGTGPNGTDRILFQLGRERGSRSFAIWSIDVGPASAGQPSMLASSGSKAFINPEWSPDGEWVVYAQAEPTTAPSPAATAELWMMHSSGEGQVRLTGSSATATSPAWASPERVFFVSNRDGRNGVWSMDMASAVATAQLAIRTPDPVAADSETPPETLGQADAE